MKKIAALVGAAAMLLGMAVPAFAYPFLQLPSNDVSIHNYGYVKNDVDTNANSGLNSTSGFWHGGVILTGGASSLASVGTDVNTTIVGCDCVDDLSIRNYGTVKNYIDTNANTGLNHTFGGGFISTGGALGQSVLSTFVNLTAVSE